MASAPPLLICNALKAAAGTQVCVRGWVRSVRKHARRSFIQLNDGLACGYGWTLRFVVDAGLQDHAAWDPNHLRS